MLGLSGTRGGISPAAALSVPITAGVGPFPARDEIIFLTYMVLLTTLVVPGLMLGPLIERSRTGTGEDLAVSKAHARDHVLQAALDHVDELLLHDELPEEIVDRLRMLYATRGDRLGGLPPVDWAEGADSERLRRAVEGAVAAQRRALANLEASQLVGTRTARQLERELERAAAEDAVDR